MNEVIYITATLPCAPARAFAWFTENELLEKWLTVKAEVEPRLGGRYELFWNPDDRAFDSTFGCRITAFARPALLAFTWKGPKQYAHFMNDADPLVHAAVAFVPAGAAVTHVHFVLSGWRASDEWQEARRWFEGMWGGCLKELAALAT